MKAREKMRKAINCHFLNEVLSEQHRQQTEMDMSANVIVQSTYFRKEEQTIYLRKSAIIIFQTESSHARLPNSITLMCVIVTYKCLNYIELYSLVRVV